MSDEEIKKAVEIEIDEMFSEIDNLKNSLNQEESYEQATIGYIITQIASIRVSLKYFTVKSYKN